MIKISALVAVYNTSHYLQACFDSIYDQTMPDNEYEVIVVNDGSKDNSLEIIERNADKFRNYKVVNKKNEGTFWCRIDGMQLAEGQCIVFIDSDDIVKENLFECIYSKLWSHEKGIVEFVSESFSDERGEKRKNVRIAPGEYKPIEIAKKFVLRKISAELWHRAYGHELIKDIAEYINENCAKEKYIGIRNEDEFIFPTALFFADYYGSISDCLYSYRENSAGSIMAEIDESYEKKIHHAEVVISAGDYLLQLTNGSEDFYSLFYRLQIENLFYGIGVTDRRSNFDKELIINHYYAWKKKYFFPRKICLSTLYRYVELKMKIKRIERNNQKSVGIINETSIDK